MNCSECGERLVDGARFCTSCGRLVAPIVTCPACDAQAPEGAKFCFRCGRALPKPEDAAERQEPVLEPKIGSARAQGEGKPDDERRGRAEPTIAKAVERRDTGIVPPGPHASDEHDTRAAPGPAPAPASLEQDVHVPASLGKREREDQLQRDSTAEQATPERKDRPAAATAHEDRAAKPRTAATDTSAPRAAAPPAELRPPLRPASARSFKEPSPPAQHPSTLNGVFRKFGPIAMVLLGVALAVAAYWSAKVDEAAARSEAARRMSLTTGPLPTTTQAVAGETSTFSTRRALQGLYGRYDPNLDGVFWTVAGAPRESSDWNGKTVLIKPLVSRTDETGTRHVLVTNSVDVKGGIVVKQGAGCRNCKALLGAALFERRGDEWVLVKEQRFMRVEGAWGAPPRVAVHFPGKSGAEVRIESASADGAAPKSVDVIALHGSNSTASRSPVPTAEREKASSTTSANPNARNLVAAAVSDNHAQVQMIAAELKSKLPGRGDRSAARSLNERGLALARQGNYVEAASVFRQAHEADKGDAEIRENLGFALMKAGRIAEAEGALLATLEIAPERASAWGSLGYVYAKQGRRDEAVALLRTAHRVSPDPSRVLDTYTRQAEVDADPRVRAMLAEAVTRLSSAR